MSASLLDKIIGILNASWGYICGVGVIIGIIGAFIKSKGNANKDILKRIIIGILRILVIGLMVLSLVAGTALVKVPGIIGETYQDARNQLMDAGLDISLLSGAPIGENDLMKKISWQEKEQGTWAFRGGKIVVTFDSKSVTTEKETLYVTVPNVVGKKYTESINTLAETGLFGKMMNTLPLGIMMENTYVGFQAIEAGTKVAWGSVVELLISSTEDIEAFSSNETVTVPDLIDKTVNEAEQLLHQLGLHVIYMNTPKIIEDYYIISQSIAPGTEIPVGTGVTLRQSKYKQEEQMTVPNVIGMEQYEAVTKLKEEDLDFIVEWTDSDGSITALYVIDQSIPVGSVVPRDTVVHLKLSTKKP